MEENKKKLQFTNRAVQIQAVWRLYEEIKRKIPEEERPITQAAPQIPELGALLDGLCGADVGLGQACGEALLALVHTGILHLTRAIDLLLAGVPSVRSLSATVRVLHQLLIIEARATVETVGVYKSPYGLRSRPHPMVMALTHRPEAWHSFVQEVDLTFNHADPRIRNLSLDIIKPVVAFLLTEPQTTATHNAARRGFIRVLLAQLSLPAVKSQGRTEKDDSDEATEVDTAPSLKIQVVELLLNLLPQSPLKSSDQLILWSDLLEDLCRAIRHELRLLSSVPTARTAHAAGNKDVEKTSSITASGLHLPSAWSALCGRAFTYSLELLLECFSQDVNCLGMVAEATRLAEDCPATAMRHCDVNLLLAAEMLDTHLAHHLPTLLSLVRATVSGAGESANPLCMASLIKPLLQVLSVPAGGTSAAAGDRRAASRTSAIAREILVSVRQKMDNVSAEQLGKPEESATPGLFLGAHGRKARLYRDVCLSLAAADATKYNRSTTTTAFDDEKANMATATSVVAWATKASLALEMRRRQGGGGSGSDFKSSGGGFASASAAVQPGELAMPRLARLAAGVLFCSVSSCWSVDGQPVGPACRLVRAIARLDSSQALDFVPVILYALGQDPNPRTKLELLRTLPELATHKFCVPPILKVVQALSQSAPTRPLAVSLMTRLWRQQERCFPQLLRMLAEPGPASERSEAESRDELLAKAAAILEICQLKPEKYGAELLAPLSHILEVSKGQEGVAACVLSLDALYLLCEAEVVDIRSLVAVLEPRLKDEDKQRPLVQARLLRLLGLAPSLSVDTEQYQEFLRETASSLWQATRDNSCCVQGAAYRALANFSPDHFRVSELPEQFITTLGQQADGVKENTNKEDAASQSADDQEVSLDEMFPQIPASVYTAILANSDSLETETLKGLGAFLSAMTEQESTNLPRGVFFSSTSGATNRKSGRGGASPLGNIPSLLQQVYEKNKSPGLQSPLAAGLLFCFDPPVETGRDGRQFVLRHSNLFLQTFKQLLQQVEVDAATDWHLCSCLPGGWNVFMRRLFTAVTEGRRAQIDAQAKQQGGHHAETITDVTIATEMATAWLWARDSIVDVIRVASRGSPNSQVNSVLALAGLGRAVLRHAAGLDPASMEVAVETGSKLMGHSQWLAVAADTVLSLVDVSHKPRAGLLGLCQQTSTLDRAPAPIACSTAAQVAAAQMVPVLLALARDSQVQGPDMVVQLLGNFSGSLGSVDAGGNMWRGLALGVLLKGLFLENFSQTTGSKGMLAVWKALTALEKACLTPDHAERPAVDESCPTGLSPGRAGCVLGLSLALCGLCAQGKTESRVHVVTTLEKLQVAWSGMDQRLPIYEIFCLCVCRVAAAVHASNACNDDVATPLLQSVAQLQQQHPQSHALSLSLGVLVSTLTKLGDRRAGQLLQNLSDMWLKGISDQECPLQTKLASLHGLTAIMGSEQVFIKGSSTPASAPGAVNIVSMISKVITSGQDVDMQKAGTWMLGHLHLSACSDPASQSSVPANYSYLPESSFLRAIVDFLLEADAATPMSQICAAVQALQVSRPLPPLDWSGLLSPFMRVNCGESVRTGCLMVTTQQMATSPSAAAFVSAWVTPPLFNSLSPPSQATLHRSLPQVMRSVTPAILKLYLERSCEPAFQELATSMSRTDPHGEISAPDLQAFSDDHPVEASELSLGAVMSILKGLRDALALEDPPPSVTLVLYEAVGRFYHILPVFSGDSLNRPVLRLLQAMGECLAQLPDDVLDSILVDDFVDAGTQLKGSFVRCHLVAMGRQPVSLLNVVIDGAFNLPDWNQTLGAHVLAHCLASVPSEKGQGLSITGLNERLQWLSEMLGHTKSIATGAWPLAESAQPLNQVIDLLILTVALACLMFASSACEDLSLLGVDLDLFKDPHGEKDCTLEGGRVKADVDSSFDPGLLPNLKTYLSEATQALVTREGWTHLVPKMLDWLLSLKSLNTTSTECKNVLFDGLLSLRHSQEFSQASVWTKTVQI